MGQTKRILVVEDEKDLADLLAYNLKRGGYQTLVARTGRAALDLAQAESPDLILLDVMLPELSGTEVAQRLRTAAATAHVPIIMLTAKSAESDQVVGLTAGADDYITKPFSMKILLARVEAVLRRAGKPAGGGQGVLRMGALRLDTRTHEAFLEDEPLKLTLTEFRLLTWLIQAGGRVLSRASLMSRAMGPGVTVTERTIDVHMTSLRKKLGAHAGLLKTVRGVGYRASMTDAAETAEQTG